jgi:large subunit ribosomal protein L9
MEVILLEKTKNLGQLGDLVNVKGGYARNYLLPYGKAVSATKKNREKFETRRVELEKAAIQKLETAQQRAVAISDLTITITARAGEQNKLYGSVGPREIADAISAQKITVTKNEILMPNGPIHHLGEHDVKLQLHSDVELTIKVTVSPEQ